VINRLIFSKALSYSPAMRDNFGAESRNCPDSQIESLWEDLIMAHTGTGFFDRKGNFFKTARDATVSDLAGLLGQIGEGESLAPGIAYMLLERRGEIERLFAEHDKMLDEEAAMKAAREGEVTDNVAKLPSRPVS
jgi:hypothetical protein